MYKHSFTIGLNDKDTLRQLVTIPQAMDTIRKHMGDCTIKQGYIGTYTMDNGMVVTENTLQVDKFGGTKKQAREIAKLLCRELNQESIILETTTTRGEFIRG